MYIYIYTYIIFHFLGLWKVRNSLGNPADPAAQCMHRNLAEEDVFSRVERKNGGRGTGHWYQLWAWANKKGPDNGIAGGDLEHDFSFPIFLGMIWNGNPN